MTTEVEVPFQTAGAVDIQTLTLISSSGSSIDLKDYMSEFNLYEDLFSPSLYGTLLIVDSSNIIKEMPIIGDEYVVVKIKTPTTTNYINKTFRVYSVTNREIVRDLNTQVYILHLISKEAVIDTLKPVFKSFSGRVSDVVKSIFDKYVVADRTVNVNNETITLNPEKSKLVILTETENSVKFVSPGWTPFKCINWCASKSIPKEGKACNFVFFETIKNFYFGNIETLFRINNETEALSLGKYYYKVNQVEENKDVNEKMYNVEDFQVIKTVDHLLNYDSGYLASRLITLDVVNKKYESFDYDHVQRFRDFSHSQGDKSTPLFISDTPRNPLTNIKFYPIHPGLHNIKGNINEKMPVIYGNRQSNMMELSNFKLNINVPGRTDAEVGRMLYLSFPDVSPKSEEDTAQTNEDKYYSGFYLVTAIRHKISQFKHTMTMEIVKDALNNK